MRKEYRDKNVYAILKRIVNKSPSLQQWSVSDANSKVKVFGF